MDCAKYFSLKLKWNWQNATMSILFLSIIVLTLWKLDIAAAVTYVRVCVLVMPHLLMNWQLIIRKLTVACSCFALKKDREDYNLLYFSHISNGKTESFEFKVLMKITCFQCFEKSNAQANTYSFLTKFLWLEEKCHSATIITWHLYTSNTSLNFLWRSIFLLTQRRSLFPLKNISSIHT